MPIVFSLNNCDLSDLCRHYTGLSFDQQSLCVSASSPVRWVQAYLRVGGGGFELGNQNAKVSLVDTCHVHLVVSQTQPFIAVITVD